MNDLCVMAWYARHKPQACRDLVNASLFGFLQFTENRTCQPRTDRARRIGKPI